MISKRIVKAGLLASDLMKQFLTKWLIYHFDFLLGFALCREL